MATNVAVTTSTHADDKPDATGEAAQAKAQRQGGMRPVQWVASTYFAEGYPYTVVNNLAEILFKALGASLSAIGLTAVFHLPWNLKFLWGPLLDQYGDKRRWLIGLEVLLTVVMVLVAFFASGTAALGVISGLFIVMGFLSATHDIAIDGYYLEALDETGQSRFVGFRAMAFRLATLLLAGPALFVIDWVGWRIGLLGIAAVMGLITLVHALWLPKAETPKRPFAALLRAVLRPRVFIVGAVVAGLIAVERSTGMAAGAADWLVGEMPWLGKISLSGYVAIGLFASLSVLVVAAGRLKRRLTRTASQDGGSAYVRSFIDFAEQRHAGRILAFVALFRTGESFLMKMKWPFLNDTMGMSLKAYGLANGTVGLAASFGATMLGGLLIARHGLRRWLWTFILAQNVLNLLYMALAMGWLGSGEVALFAVICAERLGEGFGTAVFMVYLMRCCDPAHKAAHMAILTALMSIGFTVAGVLSGFIAEAIGFAHYFGFSFLMTIPSMALVFFIPHIDGREEPVSTGVSASKAEDSG